LASVTIPESVATLGYRAFGLCAGLKAITLPSGLDSIPGGAFDSCTGLTRVTIPGSVTFIGGWAFSLCTGLTSVTIPDSVSIIGDSAFYRTGLTNLTVPNRVATIGNNAFQYCDSLTSVIIGSGVTSIGSYAFSACTNLGGVYFRGNAPAPGYDAFVLVPGAVYYLPGTTGWSATFGGRSTAPWVLPTPLMLTTPPGFGVGTNGFGFIISWGTNASVVAEACTDLAVADWSPVGTNTLVDGWSYFGDPGWTNCANRFSRVRSP